MFCLGCMHPHIQTGILPKNVKCIAVLPFEQLVATQGQQEFFSEFIALDLMHYADKNVLTPGELGALLDAGDMAIPNRWTNQTVLDVAQSIGAPFVLFGYFSQVAEFQGRQGSLAETHIGVDAYILDVKNNEIKWAYNLRDVVESHKNVDFLRKLSEKMVYHLLGERRWQSDTKAESCFEKAKQIESLRKSQSESVASEMPTHIRNLAAVLKDKGMTLKSDLFRARTSEITKNAIPVLHELIQVMKYQDEKTVLVMASHVDSTGATEKDLNLSQQMGNTVKDYLLKYGVNANQIQVVSHGGSQPMVPNLSRKSREANRRIHLRLKESPQ